jgi:NhaC family Na+:H+ antiporter
MSRSLEDGGTITSVLIPWHSCAVFISGVLGVSTLDYLPYCLFNIINPILAIIVALFFIKYFNVSLNKFEKVAEEEAGIVKVIK